MIIGLLVIVYILNFYDSLNNKLKEIVNYIIVGGLTTFVSLLSYYLFRLFITNYLICTILSWICAVTFAYYANRIFVFKSNEEVIKEFVSFIGSRILSLIVEIIVMFILVQIMRVNDRIAKIIVQFIIIVLNYVFSKIFVFNKKSVK